MRSCFLEGGGVVQRRSLKSFSYSKNLRHLYFKIDIENEKKSENKAERSGR